MSADTRLPAEVARHELDVMTYSPVLFDALIAEDERALVFRTVLTDEFPGIAGQRVTTNWPHHLPGEMIISLTGQAAVLAVRRSGLIDGTWRGHGVRITEARFSAPVLVGETFYTRVEIVRSRRLGGRLHVRFNFRMWKPDGAGGETAVYRSEQDAMFFPGDAPA